MKEQEMSTLSISGTNKLAERIVGDAEAEAQRALAEANAAATEGTMEPIKVEEVEQ